MKIVNTYSFKGGEKFLKTKHPKELAEVLEAIKNLDATTCLTKESAEKTMKGALLFSPSRHESSFENCFTQEKMDCKSK